MTIYEFSSPLGEFLREFVRMKHSLGYKYEGNQYVLRMFDKICSEYSNGDVYLSKEIIDAWSLRRPGESFKTLQKRVSFSNEFAQFLLQRGISAYILPMKKKSFHSPSMFVPYVFTHGQIKAFLQTADEHPSHRAHPMSGKMYSVLFRLLYCCGLRLSEALNLKYNDINLKTSVLMIRDGKFGKDRLVPMSLSLCGLLEDYIPIIKVYQSNNPHIFPSRYSVNPVTTDCAYGYFRKILWKSGIPHGGRGKGPRLHDLRHTFSVHSLQKWVENGIDIYTAIPVLATYLGHDDLKITEKYLRLTADVYPEMLQMTEAYCGNVIPEVKFYETD